MKRMTGLGIGVIILFAGIAMIFDFGTESALAPTFVSGAITTDTTWDLAGHPYIVIGDTTVMNGVTLTIEAGVEVSLKQDVNLYVDGSLNAIGTEVSRIEFNPNSSNPWHQIQVNSTGKITMKYVNITKCDRMAIWSPNNTISHSSLLDFDWDLLVLGSSNAIVENNTMVPLEVFVMGSYNRISNNSITDWGGPGINLWGDYNTVSNNVVTNSQRGILSVGSEHNTIEDNRLEGNQYGIYFDNSGMALSEYNTITRNTVINNTQGGIYMVDSQYNEVYHNNIINNTVQAADYWEVAGTKTVNYWDDGYPSGGNYWSDWKTPDVMIGPNQNMPGSDGFVDNPYEDIVVDGTDWYPLTEPWSPKTKNVWRIVPLEPFTSGVGYSFEWTILGGVSVSHTNVHYGTDPALSVFTETGVQSGPSGTYSEMIILDCASDTQFYFMAHSVVDGSHYNTSIAQRLCSPPPDTEPPVITDIQPPDGSTVDDDKPVISAIYSDASGIDVSSVRLKIHGTDVTASATITASGVTYRPIPALSDGLVNVTINVNDTAGNQASASWSFILDTASPIIKNEHPGQESSTSERRPTISAEFSDNIEVNLTSVLLKVDGEDVTSSATVTATGVTYVPTSELSYGVHTVILEVYDLAGNGGYMEWSFTVESPTSAGDFLSEYWWVIVVILAVIIFVIVIFFLMRKKKKTSPSIQPPTE